MIGWAILAGVFYFGLAIIVAIGGAIWDAVQQRRRVRDAWRAFEEGRGGLFAAIEPYLDDDD